MSCAIAQRRPGRIPRRHSDNRIGGFSPTGQIRSTKAGAHTPATPSSEAAVSVHPIHAQRRPGRIPRRHREIVSGKDCQLPAFAQRRPGRIPRRHSCIRRASFPLPHTLNEGRGAYPGDTGMRDMGWRWVEDAQRRPGRIPRRHIPVPLKQLLLNEGRGAYPGDTLRIR